MEPRQFAWSDKTGEHEVVLVCVPGTEGDRYGFGHGDERRSIELNGFFISRTPVTQALWTYVMGENPAKHVDPRCPVENVSFEHISASGGFLDSLNASENLTAVSGGDDSLRFRL